MLSIARVLVSIEHLYKYGRLNEHSESLFSEPRIWFSVPSQFNDPFECYPWYSFEGTNEQKVESAARMLRNQNPDLTPHSANAEAVSLFLQGHHRNPEVQASAREDALRKLESVGMYCLSRIRDSILMWSHYACDHRGYCLEFNATDHMFKEAQCVHYSDDYPAVEFYSTPIEKQVELVFLTKYLGWRYEQEWRIIDFRNGSGIKPYPRDLLTGVVFGTRMPDSDKALIRSWVNRRGHNVKFYQCTQNDRKFTIDISEIE